MSVCQFVSTFVCLSDRLRTTEKTRPNFAKFLYVLPVVVTLLWLCPLLKATRYTMYFWFLDDVMFSDNAGNRPESKTTRTFRPVRHAVAPGEEYAVSDCIF